MNTAEAHEKWGIPKRKIQEYCSNGFVAGAVKDKSNCWEIPNEAIRPFHFSEEKAKEQSGRKTLILQAISREETIPDNKLTAIEGRVDELFAELIRQGLIKQSEVIHANDKYILHLLTEDGERLVNENKTFSKIMNVVSKLPPVQLHFHVQQ